MKKTANNKQLTIFCDSMDQVIEVSYTGKNYDAVIDTAIKGAGCNPRLVIAIPEPTGGWKGCKAHEARIHKTMAQDKR